MTEKSIKLDEAKEYISKLGGIINTIKQNPSSEKEKESTIFLMKILKVVYNEINIMLTSLNEVNQENRQLKPRIQESNDFGIDLGELGNILDQGNNVSEEGNNWKDAFSYGKQESGIKDTSLDQLFS